MAKKAKENTNSVASVLAFEKKLVPSDGYMFGTTWDRRNEKGEALKLIEKSVRGTISNRLSKALQADPLKLDAEVEKPNLQTVDTCSLGTEDDTLQLKFTLKVLSGVENPSACNSPEFLQTYKQAVKDYIQREEFTELAKRYATNIANGRFLWRNRVGAENIEVLVKVVNSDVEKSWLFDATEISITNFDHNDPKIKELAEKMADALSGKIDFLLLDITSSAQVGKAQEVYPSEELVFDKGKSKKSKILYSIGGIAGMHSQKIGNALRSIDTWYPEFDDVESRVGPIAIEPYGAVTNLGKAFRKPKDKVDFYTLFDHFARGGKLQNIEQEHYVMATLVRGGVFGESGKE
ncbi:MAG: type I-F CRISPR-associated protein Csy3 [Desulfamplus sp.]|nr:type I-F CRISPR-associated protein Csy3 [Desulfamplus sp.]